MAERMPVVRQIAWAGLLPQAIIIAMVAATLHLIFPKVDVALCIFLGALIYLVYCRVARAILTRDHIGGMSAYRKQKFDEAVRHFEASHRFFAEHRWIDDWRFILLGTASPNPYRTIALCNSAFCRAQLGDRNGAIENYERALEEFPNCLLAKVSLKMLRSGNE